VRIANAAGKFAAGAAGGSGGEETAIRVEGDGADGPLFVATVMFGGVFVGFALHPGSCSASLTISSRLQSFIPCLWRSAPRLGDKHHVRAIFEDFAGDLNGILDVLQSSGGAGAKRRTVHDDGVALHVAVQIEVRAVTGVEGGIVFQNHDGGFDGVECGAAVGEDGPAGSESAMAAGLQASTASSGMSMRRREQ